MAVRYEWKTTKLGRRFVRVVEREQPVPAKVSAMVIEPSDPDFVAKIETEPAVEAESAPVAVPAAKASTKSASKSGTTRKRRSTKKKSDG